MLYIYSTLGKILFNIILHFLMEIYWRIPSELEKNFCFWLLNMTIIVYCLSVKPCLGLEIMPISNTLYETPVRMINNNHPCYLSGQELNDKFFSTGLNAIYSNSLWNVLLSCKLYAILNLAVYKLLLFFCKNKKEKKNILLIKENILFCSGIFEK